MWGPPFLAKFLLPCRQKDCTRNSLVRQQNGSLEHYVSWYSQGWIQMTKQWVAFWIDQILDLAVDYVVHCRYPLGLSKKKKHQQQQSREKKSLTSCSWQERCFYAQEWVSGESCEHRWRAAMDPRVILPIPHPNILAWQNFKFYWWRIVQTSELLLYLPSMLYHLLLPCLELCAPQSWPHPYIACMRLTLCILTKVIWCPQWGVVGEYISLRLKYYWFTWKIFAVSFDPLNFLTVAWLQ